MRVGKISETALKRSVFQQLKTKRDEVTVKAAIGGDFAAMKLPADCLSVLASNPVIGSGKIYGALAVHSAVNSLVASGAEPVGVMIQALLPENFKESRLKELTEEIEAVCANLHIEVMGGHTEVTSAVLKPVLAVTAAGRVPEGALLCASGALAGQDIVMSKWIGLEGSAVIAAEKEPELLMRFPKSLVEEAKSMIAHCSVAREASAIAGKSGVSAMHDISAGGIYGALYELSEAAGVGLEIDLRAIPIRQETVELCEYLGLNPYYMKSGGSMLIVCENGQDIVRTLGEAGISAAVIGRTTTDKAKRVINGGEVSYLERPKPDELLKI